MYRCPSNNPMISTKIFPPINSLNNINTNGKYPPLLLLCFTFHLKTEKKSYCFKWSTFTPNVNKSHDESITKEV